MPRPRAPWDALWWDAADSSRCSSSTASTASRPGSTCWCAIRAALDRLRAACGREFLWEPAHDDAAAVPARARRLPRAGAAPQLRPGHRRRRVLQPRDDRRLRREPERVRRRRSTATCSGNRAWSGRCCISKRKPPARAPPASAAFTTIRSTTCSGSTGHAFQSLYHFTVGIAGRGHAADDRAGIRVGAVRSRPAVEEMALVSAGRWSPSTQTDGTAACGRCRNGRLAGWLR